MVGLDSMVRYWLQLLCKCRRKFLMAKIHWRPENGIFENLRVPLLGYESLHRSSVVCGVVCRPSTAAGLTGIYM